MDLCLSQTQGSVVHPDSTDQIRSWDLLWPMSIFFCDKFSCSCKPPCTPLLCGVCVCMCGVCVRTCPDVYVAACVLDVDISVLLDVDISVLLYHSPLSFFALDFLPNLLVQLSWPASELQGFRSLATALELQACVAMSDFLCGGWGIPTQVLKLTQQARYQFSHFLRLLYFLFPGRCFCSGHSINLVARVTMIKMIQRPKCSDQHEGGRSLCCLKLLSFRDWFVPAVWPSLS